LERLPGAKSTPGGDLAAAPAASALGTRLGRAVRKLISKEITEVSFKLLFLN